MAVTETLVGVAKMEPQVVMELQVTALTQARMVTMATMAEMDYRAKTVETEVIFAFERRTLGCLHCFTWTWMEGVVEKEVLPERQGEEAKAEKEPTRHRMMDQ